jgi:anti-sigma-K factor RskA
MSSPDIHTLTGAYALDALEEFERRQFQAHLAQCPDCAREVDELRATAARLGMAVAAQPPDTLRHRVMAQVTITRQDSPANRPSTARPRAAVGGRRAGWALRLTAAVAAVAAAAALVLGVSTVRTAQQRDAAQAQLAQVQAQYAPVVRLAAAPDAQATTGLGVAGGTAFVLASHQLNTAVLLVSNLPAPPPGHTYQAWLIGDGHPRSVGLVPPTTPTGSPPLVFGGLAGAAKVGLTIEPAGGSAQPTTTPVVLFDLPT